MRDAGIIAIGCMVILRVRRCFLFHALCRKQEFYNREPVAQLVEHRTFNAVVAGSSPARLTIISRRLPFETNSMAVETGVGPCTSNPDESNLQFQPFGTFRVA